MGYQSTRSKSSFHWTAEAYLGFGLGIARRVSYAERRSSHAERRASKSKSRRTSISLHKGRHTSSQSSHKSKPAKSYPCYHRIVTPEPGHQHDYRSHSFHDFCVASDATYARLAARLERLRGHQEAVATYVRERGDRAGLERVAEGWREEIGRLEEILEGMRRKIEEGESGRDGSGKAFLVGGRWVTFL